MNSLKSDETGSFHIDEHIGTNTMFNLYTMGSSQGMYMFSNACTVKKLMFSNFFYKKISILICDILAYIFYRKWIRTRHSNF